MSTIRKIASPRLIALIVMVVLVVVYRREIEQLANDVLTKIIGG